MCVWHCGDDAAVAAANVYSPREIKAAAILFVFPLCKVHEYVHHAATAGR